MKALFQNAKNAVQSTKVQAVTGATLAMAAVGSAHASAEAAFSEVSASGAEMAGYAWPVVASITAALIGIKLFKKFANRAS
ncbi:MAG TPA: phage coat protein [Halomonas sp.]|nr:phage coat protein [Halomonas sp.]HEB05461.1 phage coat protein [Halomonas sp.]